jgi:cell division protein FtsQ
MKINLHRIISSRAWLLGILISAIAITAIIWASLSYSGKNRLINKVIINVKPDTGVYFVNAAGILDIISKNGGSPTGKNASEVNLTEMETMLRKQPFIAAAQVFLSLDGNLKINVQQRIPVARISNLSGETYFIDSSGVKIPATTEFSPDVLPVGGNISEKLKDSAKIYSAVLSNIRTLATYISADVLWNAQFEQCHVDNYGDLILVPRVGRHSIVIGNAENLAEKFSNLRIFYEQGLRNTGWDKYRQISLKYRNQVVGVKTGATTEHIKQTTVQNPQH